MPTPFNKQQDLKLISLVKENAMLYNTRHPRYLDLDMREVIWQKIGDELNRPGSACKSRWINIRDMMRRKFKERLTNPSFHRNYKYEEELSFMTPFYKEINQSEDLTEYLDDEANCEVEMPAEVFVTENGEFEEKVNLKKRLEGGRQVPEGVYQELSPADPLDVFLITIGSTLRKFSPYYLNQAKSKIFQVVQEYELEQIVKEGQGPGSSDGNR